MGERAPLDFCFSVARGQSMRVPGGRGGGAWGRERSLSSKCPRAGRSWARLPFSVHHIFYPQHSLFYLGEYRLYFIYFKRQRGLATLSARCSAGTLSSPFTLPGIPSPPLWWTSLPCTPHHLWFTPSYQWNTSSNFLRRARGREPFQERAGPGMSLVNSHI